eukprot:CAMPEP_0168479562 /NCGR_PEP_ID=MMETSP0228-20121227/63535_1 /TAXON_ID=133427 /ORGANISM="Protoceratium reticulatum, Strain CCCM 535 (=CCMP 1889)" /LENGTH=93 /DNA_ID=CAMNT_0008495853 /DNA_START=68 /DNA_END=345 /DNA_ORIENTATION=+
MAARSHAAGPRQRAKSQRCAPAGCCPEVSAALPHHPPPRSGSCGARWGGRSAAMRTRGARGPSRDKKRGPPGRRPAPGAVAGAALADLYDLVA